MPVTKPKDGDFFDPAHPTTKKMYEDNKMMYPKTSDEKALELKMDKIRTYDGKYNFNNSVVRICRYMDDNGDEWLDTEEWVTGRSSIGNPQEYWSRRTFSHDEPDVNQMATLQNGEQIIVTGDFVKHVRRVFELPWADFKADKDGIRSKILENSKDKKPSKLQLRVEGFGLPRSYAGTYKQMWDIFLNYDWDDLIQYCQKGIKKDDVDSLKKQFNRLPKDKKAELLASIK